MKQILAKFRGIRQRRLARRVAMALAFPVILIMAACAAIMIAGLRDNIARADCAVVLGSKVEISGEPSERLTARLQKAVELYRAGTFPNIIVSGGVGKEGHDEAAVMKRELVARGVPAESVLEDNQGLTSWATAQNSAAIMRAHGWNSALIISQYFHVPRTRVAFTKAGIKPLYWAHANYFALRDFYSVPREVAGMVSYMMR